MATNTFFHNLHAAKVRVVEYGPDDDSRFWSLELRDNNGNELILIIRTAEEADMIRNVMDELPAHVEQDEDYEDYIAKKLLAHESYLDSKVSGTY
jgi:hypothetical protein